MRHSTHRAYRLKLPVKMLVFGLWIVFFALFVLYFALKLMGAMSAFDAGVLSSDTGMNLDVMLLQSIAALYRGGIVTLGIGGIMMSIGGVFLMSTPR